MKLFLFFIFNAVFLFISCKCNCEGDAPVISPQNEKLIIFKNDSIIDFIRNQTDTIQIYVSRFHSEDIPKAICTDPSLLFRKSCICASDYTEMDGYEQKSYNDSISFRLHITTDKKGSSVYYSFNQRFFYGFDSSNISKIINNKLIRGLSFIEFTNSTDPFSRIYYKDSLGLVSVVYKSGKTVDLK